VPGCENFCDFLADDLVDVTTEGDDQNDEVIHGTTDGEGLGVVVKAVAAGKVSNIDLLVHLVNRRNCSVSKKAPFTLDAPNLVK